MSQPYLNIIIIGIIAVIVYVLVMNLPYFKQNKRHGGFLTIGIGVATLVLAVVLYVMKAMQS